MSELILGHAVHGYDAGHRLLFASVEFSGSEAALLETLSDLSGYVPATSQLTPYITGFPCERFFVLAKTWPDEDADRGGTVLTHSLLLDRHGATKRGLGTVMGYLARPQRGDWSAVARAAPREQSEPGTLALEEALETLILLLGNGGAPVAHVEARSPTDLVCLVWSWLWPRARYDFSFCTLALGPRRLGQDQYLDLSIVPRSSRAAFSQPDHTLWDGGRLYGEKGRLLADDIRSDGWIRELVDDPATARAVVDELIDEGVPACNRFLYPIAAQYVRMLTAARADPRAARARFDLLRRLADPADAPGAWANALTLRLQQLSWTETPLFWEMKDVLEDEMLRPLLSQSSQLAGQVDAAVSHVLETARPEDGRAAIEVYLAWVDLLRYMNRPPSLDVLPIGSRASAIRGIVAHGERDLATQLFAEMTPDERRASLDGISLADDAPFIDLATQAMDAPLLARLNATRGTFGLGMETIATWLDHGELTEVEFLDALRVAPLDAVDWMLSTTAIPPALAPRMIAKLLRNESAAHVLSVLEGRNASLGLIAQVTKSMGWERGDLIRGLRRSASLCRRVLSEPTAHKQETLVLAALDAAGPEGFRGPGRLASSFLPAAQLPAPLVKAVCFRLLAALSNGGIDSEDARQWLADRDILAVAPTQAMLVSRGDRQALLRLIESLGQLGSDRGKTSLAVAGIIESSPGQVLEALPRIASIYAEGTRRERIAIGSALAEWMRDRDAAHLEVLRLVFSDFYDWVPNLSMGARVLRVFFDDDQKDWAAWLAHQAVRHGWQPTQLAGIVRGNTRLLKDLKSPMSSAAWRNLGEALSG